MDLRSIIIGTILSVFMLMASCATKEKMTGLSPDPAASGKLTADKAKGGNTDLTVKVEHLATPDRISPNAKDYVIWVMPEGTNVIQNVGVLSLNSDLDGKYETTIPYDKFRVIITPEPNGNVTQPSGPAVFDQSIAR